MLKLSIRVVADRSPHEGRYVVLDEVRRTITPVNASADAPEADGGRLLGDKVLLLLWLLLLLTAD